VGDVDWFPVLVHLVIGGVLLWTGVRGWQGTLPMAGPGIRTPRTMDSPTAWRVANRAGGPWLTAAGALAAAAGVALVPLGGGDLEPWLTGLGTGGAVALAIWAYRVGVRSLREDV
jgi:hypothetical protein